MDTQSTAINKIRSFNRFYTNVLGLLDQYILDSGYSLTEVRVLLEISKVKSCTANSLVNQLVIDRSYMSRIIKRLEKDELITKLQSERDNRVNLLTLTEKGKQTISALNQKSDEQIKSLFQRLGPDEIIKVLDSMAIIKSKITQSIRPITIRNFTENDIDYVISSHRTLYEQEYGLSSVFGDYVEKGVRHFIHNYNSERECMLIPEINGRPVGSIVIVKADEETAQLRYFLLEPETRGRGLGLRLVDKALEFCRDKGYKRVFLETICFLETARHIYASKGFRITQTHKNPSWGKDVLEERWDIIL
jgi:DNA-binding MarR family transcriptional regulator/GNAT superfamily N-acetyltransferase